MKNNKINNKFLKFLLSVKGGIVISLVILLAVFSIFVFQKSYSYASDWHGYTLYESSLTTNAGYNNAYFLVHLGKNGVKYATDQVDMSLYTPGTDGSSALYQAFMNGSRTWVYENSNVSNMQVGNNVSGNQAVTYKTGIAGATQSGYIYLGLPFKIKIPRGYKYKDCYLGYDRDKFGVGRQLYPYEDDTRIEGQSAPWLFNSSSGTMGPFEEDTWIGNGSSIGPGTGFLDINITGTGATLWPSDKGSTSGKFYRQYESLSIDFESNRTTIKFNANGGTGSMSNQTHVYDTALTLSDNTFTRDGYTFKEWNTEADGSGTSYANKGSISATAYPTESEVTLYAIWDENESTEGTASITYDDSSLIKSDDKVFKNDVITYKITYTEGSTSVNNITILDTLSKELEYVPNSSSLGEPSIVTNADGSSSLSWEVTTLGSMTFKVKVKSDDSDRVRNSCSVSFDDDVHKLNDLINFINHKYTVNYETDKYGTLDAKSELVLEDENPRGVTDTPNNGYKTLMWKCDKPVTLSTGKVIFKNLPIQKNELTQIIVEEDLVCTVTHKLDNTKTYNCEG